MTHFGILCPTTSGHINSVLPLGQELQRRGHRVTCFLTLDGEEVLTLPRVNRVGFFSQRLLSSQSMTDPDRTPTEAISFTGCPTATRPRFLITWLAATSRLVVYPQFGQK
jgi:hypothetical protein